MLIRKTDQKYKIQQPITTIEELENSLPHGESVPLWWDDAWSLFYHNIWGRIRYMGPDGQGDFQRRKFFLYRAKPTSEFIIEQREYDANNVWGEKISTRYLCPNCGEDLIPYDHDFERQLINHNDKVKYCPDCGYPLLWY